MVEATRLREMNERETRGAGKYVLYWMQASQRVRGNYALEYAIERANALGLPVVVCFGLMDDYPEANERHYAFMLEGLADVARGLAKRGIRFVMKRGEPAEVALHYGRGAAEIVCDRGYTRHQRRWREKVGDEAECRVTEVEGDVVVPVEVASEKAEWGARTIRPKILKVLKEYLVETGEGKVERKSTGMEEVKGDVDPLRPEETLKKLKVDRGVTKSAYFVGGEVEAGRRLEAFVEERLKGYGEGRNEPAGGQSSRLSPYLQFGQISPVEVALRVMRSGAPKEDKAALIEELVVRRELAANFVEYTAQYDQYEGLPAWARRTLKAHQGDKREYVYTREELEAGETHDRYWNAAQREMVRTGYMQNYMRMYWGKKILEWSGTPEGGYGAVLGINNKYFIDGRGPNAFANVGWIFGLHDRPWGERGIFGQVRYMNAAGLERKFDMARYLRRVEGL